MIENLFPTAVGFYELDKPVTEKELQFIKDLETRANDGNTVAANINVVGYSLPNGGA